MNQSVIKQVGSWIGIVAGIFTVALGIPALWALFNDNLENSDDFIGIWESKYTYSISNGVTTVEGTTEYFRNGKYNFTGVMSIDSNTENSGSVKVTYDVDGTGEWSNDSEFLYVTLTNSISYPKLLQVNSKNYPLDKPKFKELVPKLESFIPSDMSEQYELLSKGSKMLKLEVDDPMGKKILVVMNKVTKRYQR